MLVKGILGLFPFALAAPSCAHLPTLGGKLAITHGNRQNPLILLLAGFGKP